jgi:hypothetical protein
MGLSDLDGNERFSFAAVEGRLVVASNNPSIAVITRSNIGALSYSYIRLKVRDQWGVTEWDAPQETDPKYRSPYQTDSRIYNLSNQGWAVPRLSSSGVLDDPIWIYFSYTSSAKYPSDIETVWQGLQFRAPATSTEEPSERLYATMFDALRGSGASAAKGYFIIDLLRRGGSRYAEFNTNKTNYALRFSISDPSAGIPNSLPLDYTSGGASVVEEFAGRVFFAGFKGDINSGDSRSPSLTNYVAFSQLVKNSNDIGKCYQSGDPTSRDGSDLIDTDGGLIRVSGASKIVALKNMGTHLVVFATNGVWAITGGAEYGFSATNYKVSKVSSYGCSSPASIVSEGDRVYFMADTGIFIVGKNQFGDMTVDSLTVTTIQSLYDDIPLASKQSATGVYDLDDKKIRWIYKTGTAFTSTSKTYELVFDVRLGAFCRNQIYSATNYSAEVYGAFVDTSNVLRYVTLYKSSSQYYLTASLYKNTSFIDWSSTGAGVDAKGYLLTGAFTGGDSSIEKQAPYLVMHFERTEGPTDSEGIPTTQSSCLVRSQWGWADTIDSKKWSPLFQTYRYRRPMFNSPSGTMDNGFDLVTSKSKLRGRGKSLSLYMETEPGKDCQIVGWNLSINGNQTT